MDGADFSFDRPLKKMQLISNESHYGPAPDIGDVAEQRLTIMHDGRAWFSQYCYGAVYNKPSLAEKHHFHISREAADVILNAVSAAFCHGYEEEFIEDSGSWYLTLTDSSGHKFKATGPLFMSTETAVTRLSDLIRKALDRSDLFLFDGNLDYEG